MLYHNILLLPPSWVAPTLAPVVKVAGKRTLPVLQADSNRDPGVVGDPGTSDVGRAARTTLAGRRAARHRRPDRIPGNGPDERERSFAASDAWSRAVMEGLCRNAGRPASGAASKQELRRCRRLARCQPSPPHSGNHRTGVGDPTEPANLPSSRSSAACMRLTSERSSSWGNPRMQLLPPEAFALEIETVYQDSRFRRKPRCVRRTCISAVGRLSRAKIMHPRQTRHALEDGRNAFPTACRRIAEPVRPALRRAAAGRSNVRAPAWGFSSFSPD